MSAINPVSSADFASAADTSSRVTNKSLTQTDFLKVMVAQLSQQDPFKAADSSKFMEDFMTMGNFQAMQDMSTNMNKVFSLSLVGQNVEVVDDKGLYHYGVVQGAKVMDGELKIMVNDSVYSAKDISAIIAPTVETTTGS